MNGQRVPHPIHHTLGIELGVAHQEDAELVAAETAGDVGCADRLADHIGGLLEEEVADDVTELVVHLLQAVDVEEQQGDGGSGPARHQELVFTQREEATPVRETGQIVHGRVPAEFLLELGQVLPGPYERTRQ